jgi:ABC-type nitrate/sulfonate/bicarbonate transport system permease component
MFGSGLIFPHILETTKIVLIALAIGAAVGIVVALLLAVRPIGWLFEPAVTVAYAIPKVGLISYFILWLGLNETSHTVLVVTFVAFVYLYNMRQAIEEVDQGTLKSMRLMGASHLQVVRLLILPSSTSYLLAATRVALPLAYAAEIFAELSVPTPTGLGSLLVRYTNVLDGPGAISVMLIVVAIGYLADALLVRAVAWHARLTGTGTATT